MSILNIPGILARVRAAETAAVEEVADFVARDAKARAPVRKVFREAKGFKRKFRPLTSPEKALAIRRLEAFRGYDDFTRRRVKAHITNYARAEIRRPGSANSLARSGALRHLGKFRANQLALAVRNSAEYRAAVGATAAARLHPLLSSRGRYEVKSGRALQVELSAGGNVGHIKIGGRLKASIGNEGAVPTDNGVVAKVAARVRYAKYVEFPTTHNASQPFLLPALHGNRGRLRATLARELKSRLGG